MDRESIILLTFAVYLIVLLGIGIFFWRRTHDLSDYILGGRKLGSLVAALSAGASDMSGWLLLGLPGYAYVAGLEAIWIGLGLLVGIWCNWKLVAARLRRYTELAGNSLTLPDFFEQRFQDNSRLLRIISAFLILFFFLIYTSSGLVAGGKLFASAFGLPYQWAVMTGALAIVMYTFLGGFRAVSLTDVIQALLMVFALAIVPVIALQQSGGLDNTLTELTRTHPSFLNPFTSATGEALSATAVVSLLAWGLGYFGQPHILARFMAIKHVSKVVRARRIAIIWSTISMIGAILAGISGKVYFVEILADSEKVFILLVESLFHPVVAGICLAAILSAIMSTADSQLLVAASALTEDFYKALLRKDASQRELVWLGRLTVVFVAVVACAMAMDPGNKVLDLVAYAWAGFGASFGPLILFSLFWRRTNRTGALAGILSGGLMVIIWKQLSGGIFDVYEIVPGFFISSLAIVLFSLLGLKPSEEQVSLFDKATQKDQEALMS
jgi:sodium/proline symporter